MNNSANRHFQQAIAAFQSGDLDEAERGFRKVLRDQPRHVGALNLIGILMMQRKRHEEAERYLRQAIAADTRSDVTFYNYGIVQKALKKPAEALKSFSQALALNGSVAESWNNRGTVQNDLQRYEDAIVDFEKAITLKPNYAEAYCNKGNSLTELSRFDDALAAHDRALALNPAMAEAWVGRGSIFERLHRYQDALSAYDKALSLNANLAHAWLGRGDALGAARRYREASDAYERAIALDPAIEFAPGRHLHAKMQICDWHNFDAECAQILSGVRSGKAVCSPFICLTLPSSQADQLQCAATFADVGGFAIADALCRGERYEHERIRVAYLSADFHDHATAHLMAGLFEQHDRAQFEITAISFGPDSDSPMRQRLIAAFDNFVDVRTMSDRQIAESLRASEIDIAIDLKGYTQNARSGILARRPAPVQVNYLGYPGTMGVGFIDYLIADPVLIKPEDETNYSEKIVYLRDSYQVNDSKRKCSPKTVTRRDAGLPEQAFVFCSFNNNFKITPDIFARWMGLLRKVDGSVLWLLHGNEDAPVNLREEAKRHNIAPDRLIFAPLVTPEEHLSRYGLADLFLDTLPYNAHTTASEALWAGLPVVTCEGPTFASRVAASLLQAAGFPDLVTTSHADYEALAIKLATDRQLLLSIRSRLEARRHTCALFDTERFARHIELAYKKMVTNHRAGLRASFAVEAIL